MNKNSHVYHLFPDNLFILDSVSKFICDLIRIFLKHLVIMLNHTIIHLLNSNPHNPLPTTEERRTVRSQRLRRVHRAITIASRHADSLSASRSANKSVTDETARSARRGGAQESRELLDPSRGHVANPTGCDFPSAGPCDGRAAETRRMPAITHLGQIMDLAFEGAAPAAFREGARRGSSFNSRLTRLLRPVRRGI